MKRIVAAALVAAMVSPAWADPRKMLVLQAEGRSDGKIKVQVDAAIIKLAKTTDAQISPGDISMTDAAAAVGCQIDAPGCSDEILQMLSVDELVYAVVSPKPGGNEVIAYRIGKGGTKREAKSMILTGKPADKIDGVAALFLQSTTNSLPPAGTPTPVAEPPVTTAEPQPLPTTTELPPEPTTTTTTTTTTVRPAEQPPQYVDQPQPKSKWPLIGTITGGGMVLLGFACWGKASSVQSEIDGAPTATRADLNHIKDLEKNGDGFAGLGNIMFIGGAVLGGISAYYLVKQRRSGATTTARIQPTAFDHGAGIALTIGGSP
ncbi:MAG TPA: hypothetical protein VGM90_32370 [Kofleriaceae bacterium]